MICFENIRLFRNSEIVLQDISLVLSEKRIAVIGANGSGKSSFVRLINGLLSPQEGEITVNQLNPAKEGKKIREKVGFLFQNPEHQIIMPIVREDVAFSLKNQGIAKQQRLQQADDLLQKMNISHLANRSSHMLSGGEKQLVALAGVLVMKPDILVMDEPTTLLDLRHFNDLKKRIMTLQQQTIIVTHDMNLATICERVIVLHEGKVICDAKPNDAIAFYQQKMSVN